MGVRFRSLAGSAVSITVESKPVFGVFAHSPTFSTELPSIEVSSEDASAIRSQIHVEFDALKLDPGPNSPPFDRSRMLDNLRGKQVLDVEQWPTITFTGCYEGTRQGGTLDGKILVRGAARAIRIPVQIAHRGNNLHATGTWEGTLTVLGIKPFRALLGALVLKDWARISFALELAEM